MINNNGKGGNPYHDESGKFTSKEGQGSGGSEAKSEKNLTSSSLDNRISLAIEDAKESAKYWGFEDTNEDIARGIAYDLSPKFGSFEDIKAKALEKLNQDSPEVKEEKEVKSKWNVSTLDGEILSEKPIEASSEEEAFKLAEQMYPGHGDELMVDEAKEGTNPVLDKMGLDKNDLKNEKFAPNRKQNLNDDVRKMYSEEKWFNNEEGEKPWVGTKTIDAFDKLGIKIPDSLKGNGGTDLAVMARIAEKRNKSIEDVINEYMQASKYQRKQLLDYWKQKIYNE